MMIVIIIMAQNALDLVFNILLFHFFKMLLFIPWKVSFLESQRARKKILYIKAFH